MRKTMLASTLASALVLPSLAAAEESPHTLSTNVGLFSEYVFRGLTQTDEEPAIQGGLDYSYNFGPASVYAGTWASNISWLKDSGQYKSSSIEWDFYGGVRGNILASDFTYDVGYLLYYYPGNVAVGGEGANTNEIYGALGWKWLTAKYSYSIGDRTFAVRDSRGTWYLDLSASVPVLDTGLTLSAHWGKQKFKGTDDRTAPLNNNTLFSYEDWKVGASYDLGKLTKVLSGATAGVYWTTTNANPAGYTIQGNNIGDNHLVGYFQKTF